MYIKSEIVELKEKYTDTIIRDIVAFLNSNGGKIYVGINDCGKVIGIPSNLLDDIQKKISDCIALQIEPNPQGEISTRLINEDGKNILLISINKGYKPIYCIKKYGFSSKGCLIRIGIACKEMNPIEISYRYKENLIDDDYILAAPAHYSPLSFEIMQTLLTSKGFQVEESLFESYFSLIRKDGSYNLMAELLADKNMVPLNFVKFRGNTKASISQRSDYGGQSIILGLQRLKDRLIAENICVTDTTVRPRIDEYLYDIDCVNEVLITAIVHNDWTITEPLVCFFNDRLEITYYGGLPKGITKDEYFKGVSHPRNNVLMRIFLKLGIIENTSNGITKVIEKYGEEAFDIHENYINVVIPFNRIVLKETYQSGKNDGKNQFSANLNANERRILLELINNPSVPYDKLVVELNISRRTVSRVFVALVEKGYIERVGTNKTGYWKVIK